MNSLYGTPHVLSSTQRTGESARRVGTFTSRWEGDEIIPDRGAGMRAAGPLGRDKRSDSQHRGHADEHVLRLLAENEMLRSTVAAYR